MEIYMLFYHLIIFNLLSRVLLDKLIISRQILHEAYITLWYYVVIIRLATAGVALLHLIEKLNFIVKNKTINVHLTIYLFTVFNTF
jgi:hypothetical protein